jgi:S-adenosylmethionine-dependent methyltransferase
MPGGEDRWAPLADRFVDGHYGTLRGKIRTYVIDRHLRDHLVAPPARIVDVGGGAGHQSLPLARDGFDVTIVDPSAAMLERATRLIAAEPPDVARRIDLVEASAQEAPSVLGDGGFDAVLCHGVIMYVEDPVPFVASLSELAKPGAVVSIVAKNAGNLAIRPALMGDWQGALAAFETIRQINGLGVDTRGDTVEALTEMLADVHVTRIAWYGVRLFTDGWAPDRPATDPEPEVLAVELEASRRDPYRQMSRLFHLVGRKTS